MIEVASGLLSQAFRGNFPIRLEPTELIFVPTIPPQFDNNEGLVAALEALIGDLEQRLEGALKP